MKLNPEQESALSAIHKWVAVPTPRPFLLLGGAGTGKTFTVGQLLEGLKGRVVLTAPTNKAVKVLRDSMTKDDYKPECRTIYSLLGLKLEANGEVKELTAPEDPVDLTKYKFIVVDEASMLNKSVMQYIEDAANNFGVKFLFMGDACQLPPVGESFSRALDPLEYDEDCQAKLEKVMRHDNQILTLATELRRQISLPNPKIDIRGNNSDGQGVFASGGQDFMLKFTEAAASGILQLPNSHKLIAWRNATVDCYNSIARRAIFQSPKAWEITDRVIFTNPAKDVEDKPMASTDDEGEITRVLEDWHWQHKDIKTLRISITLDDNRLVNAVIPHPDYEAVVGKKLQKLSEAARLEGRKWREFWAFKEAFHSLRHAYAITAHRSQGSTYDVAYVDWRDILLNRNRQEAFKCLYVAATRPKSQLIFN
jgi:exodeoxyribonuclease-5